MSNNKKFYIIMKPGGDAIKSASVGATMKEIRHFKYFPYISYGEAI